MAGTKRLERKDLITIGMSSVALLVSLTNIYLSYFRVDDEVLARIVDVWFEAGSADSQSNYSKNGFAVLMVAFTNTGNRPAVIGRPRYDLGFRQVGSDEPEGFGGRALTPENAVPFVLPPKEIRLVPLSIPISCMIAGFKRGLEPPSAPGEEAKRIFEVGLTYRAVDSKGQAHAAWSSRQIYVRISPQGWDGFGPTSGATSTATGSWRETKLFGPRTIERAPRSITLFQPPEPGCDELLGARHEGVILEGGGRA